MKPWIIFLFFLIFQGSAQGAVPENPTYLWLQYGEKQNERDGSITQTIYLKSSNESFDLAKVKDLRAFYWDGTKKGQRNYYNIPIKEQKNSYYLQVTASSRFVYQIVVTGTYQGEHYKAQIAFPLYTNAFKEKDNKEEIKLENGKLSPFIDFKLTALSQTGKPLKFLYKPISPENKVQEIRVVDLSKNYSEKIFANSEGIFSLVPPHDKNLDNGGSLKYKELIIYAEEMLGNQTYKTSMNILLRRSAAAHRNLGQGVQLFFATMVISLLVILLQRRRFAFK